MVKYCPYFSSNSPVFIDGVNLTNEYFQARIQGQTLLLSMETNGFDPNNARIQGPTPLLSTETKGFETNYDYITHLVLLPCYGMKLFLTLKKLFFPFSIF